MKHEKLVTYLRTARAFRYLEMYPSVLVKMEEAADTIEQLERDLCDEHATQRTIMGDRSTLLEQSKSLRREVDVLTLACKTWDSNYFLLKEENERLKKALARVPKKEKSWKKVYSELQASGILFSFYYQGEWMQSSLELEFNLPRNNYRPSVSGTGKQWQEVYKQLQSSGIAFDYRRGNDKWEYYGLALSFDCPRDRYRISTVNTEQGA